MNRKLVVHIDRLVLRGVSLGERDRVVATLQRELERALAQPGALQAWQQLGTVDRLRVPALRVPPRCDSAQLARVAALGLARAVPAAAEAGVPTADAP